MEITKDSLIMSAEEMLQTILEKLEKHDSRFTSLERRLTSIENKLNVIEVKVDNLGRLMQVDEMPEHVRRNYDLQPVPQH